MHHEMRQGIIVLGYNLALPRDKDSAKFRFSEENTNKFAFLSVRKLSKSSEKPNFIWIFPISKIKTRVRHLINVKWSHFLYFEG